MRNLTDGDTKRLIEIHKEVKAMFVKNLIDIFVNPGSHQINTREGNKIPIKNVFCLEDKY